MCDINCIWLFNLLVAFVLIIQQQQNVVVCSIQTKQTQQPHQQHHLYHHQPQQQQQQQRQKHHQQQQQQAILHSSQAAAATSPYDGITSYATALAAKYLHQHSLPKVNVVKREIKNDKNTDFISYLSDFNMQDETSIPEDIFDQRHLKEIEEKELNIDKRQKIATADTSNTADDDDDAIDVNLPYDDDADADMNADTDIDAEAEADIILESQRSIERNFSSNDDDSKYNNNSNDSRNKGHNSKATDRDEGEVRNGVDVSSDTENGLEIDGIRDMSELRPKDNSPPVPAKDNVRKENNMKKNFMLKEKKKLNNVKSNDKKRQQDKEIKYENYIKSSSLQFPKQQYTYEQQLQQTLKQDKIADDDNYYDSLIDDEEDDDDGSAEYERFKLMHEQKQKELLLQKEHDVLQQELERKRQQQQQREQLDKMQLQQQQYHMSTWKKLNEAKFNNQNNNNEEEASIMKMSNMDDFDKQSDQNNDGSKTKKYKDYNDESEDFQNLQQQQQENKSEEQQQQQQQQQEQQQQQQQDAIGDIDDEQPSNENDSIFKESVGNTPEKRNNENTNIFIPRKMKRHNGAARLDDATNRYSRIKNQQENQEEEQQQQPHQIHQQRYQSWPEQQTKSHSSNENHDDDNDDENYGTVDNTDEYMPHFGRQHNKKEESFKKSYYGIVNENSTQSDDTSSSSNSNSNSQSKNNNSNQKNNENDEHHVNANHKDIATIKITPPLHDDDAAREERREQQQSLFEKEKSLRRNNKHYGHKSHKKKYKDYLRYSSLMMIRPTATSTAGEATARTTFPSKLLAITTTPASPTTVIKTTKSLKFNHPNSEDILRFHKENYGKKLKMEKLKSLGLPASPIFVLKAKTLESQEKMDSSHHAGAKPFYEGQINYYLETDDDDDLLGGRGGEARFITKGDRMDTNDWYRKLSPVLRNGVKTGLGNNERDERLTVTNGESSPDSGGGSGGSTNAAVAVSPGYTPYHHYRTHHQRNQHHHHGSSSISSGGSGNNGSHQKHHHHHQHSRHHAYQRKMLPKKQVATTTPLPPPSRRHETNSPIQELAHQITDVKEFERYYAKWPHLARVQSQLHDEQLREQLELQNLQQQQFGNYQDYEYDEDYFEALQAGKVEENVPPYIRKYNRRNKQLLDLLEGTMPPPTRTPHQQQQQLRWSGSKLQPGPRDSSVGSMSVRIDDDYLKEKRKRYHLRQKQIHDLFEQQRTITTTTTTTTVAPSQSTTMVGNTEKNSAKVDTKNSNSNSNSNHYENHLPDEDISISLETQEHDENEANNWQTLKGGGGIKSSLDASSKEGKSQITWQKEKLLNTSMAGGNGNSVESVTPLATTLKPAVYKLPSYPSIAGSFIQRPRSRSAQFAPSSGSEYRRVTPLQFNSGANNFINAGGFVAFNGAAAASSSSKNNNAHSQNNGKSMSARFTANDEENKKGVITKSETQNSSKNNKNNQQTSTAAATSSSSSSSPSSSSSSSSPASVSNSFVYHRVIDASPRFVGAGLTGRKQRLPFVAITDRRLETSKKSLTDHQKDFEQNHYPMP